MTDHQFDSIIEMIDMILDGCKDLQEAQKKIRMLKKNAGTSESTETQKEG